MKKQIFVLATAFVMTLSTAIATETTPVPRAIVNELKQEFRGAGNVQWKATSNYYKASFTIGTQAMDAFYSPAGKLVAVSRTINPEQLPMVLVKEIKTKGAFKDVTNLFEILSDRGTEYYISFGSGTNEKTFKSSGEGWSRYYGS